MKKYRLALSLFALFATALLAAGCSQGHAANSGWPAMPPPAVSVVTVSSEKLPVTSQLPGRLDAVRTAQVRARVTDILLKQVYKEGTEVKEGDVLFQIDPAPLKAQLDSAQAGLAKARANLEDAAIKAQRYKALVAINAVSRQDYADALSASMQAKADVQSAQAAVEVAKLNLGYATVTAPISGHIGPALVTEGALVSQTDATPMALIQQLDPIYFDFTESSTDELKLRQAFEKGRLQKVATDEVKVTLLLEDGTTYKEPGTLLFTDTTVDPGTGMVTLRAIFPNPGHLLLPGMFARCRIDEAVDPRAILAPQQGIILGPNGEASALVVTDDNKVQSRPVKLGPAVGNQWVVTQGLKAGERIIVEGLQKVRPGMKVSPEPFK
ncbi:MAG: efflux RND transporter periplasmic adaptor subunit [Candidatus Omnitrophica bacterium]|nr:efflux RND transporter periplasmic adaptor subunit [Candidatus Omnitrophota bacterium]MDE2010299.1 efflux RND transporter periplasmic adaptor subunit [Candidatus Omnitrophota bacterium]MDE2214740.1 efflux RND transporter periplasmic adaptor subunit [Candidatus Omnitrophota bacterium]MDE2231777.1 efflux RND transporter periplasmic adaptor subunit [Candidatus Omnitrophota bacterium]